MSHRLADPATFETVIRRSRFIAHAAAVEDEAQTLTFYEAVADPSATHNCWAWRIGTRYRSSDDGEPSGSAGRPILAAIDGAGIDHAMVVVTRHYGGINLGIGGLIRAYGGSAAKCIDRAGVVAFTPQRAMELQAGFEWSGAVHALLDEFGAEKGEERFDSDGLRLRFRVAERRAGELAERLRDATRGAARLRRCYD